jgi:hypothetical protein
MILSEAFRIYYRPVDLKDEAVSQSALEQFVGVSVRHQQQLVLNLLRINEISAELILGNRQRSMGDVKQNWLR